MCVCVQLGVLEREAKQLGQDFLALEKFVNLNYQAFEKLLKNHDKLMPGTPCHQFYMTKLRYATDSRSLLAIY